MPKSKISLKILHLEDDPADSDLILAILREENISASLDRVDNHVEFVRSLTNGTYDLILADFSLPEFDGISALRIVQEKQLDLPFIFVTGTLGEELAVECLKSGATDYVLKNKLYRLIPALMRTINEQEEKKKRIQAEENYTKLASVVEQATAAVIITDLEGNINYVNPAFVKMSGYSGREVLGKCLRDIKTEFEDPEIYKNFLITIRAGKTWSGTSSNYKKDGTLYYEKTVIFPIKNSENRIINYAAINHDVTSNYELSEQLRQAQKLENIGQLAGGIAHDFNNYLSIINGYAELSMATLSSKHPVYKKIKEISSAGSKASNLVRQLLAFSRKQIIQPKILKANDLITSLEKMLNRLIGEDIRITLDLAGDTGFIKADPGQFEQILINLIVNARDALNMRVKSRLKKRITIKTEKVVLEKIRVTTLPDYYTRITVSDNGTGMSPETMHKVFEPFFTTKMEGEGTGLGLSTVYGIVKQNNGHISVQSKEGKGCIFIIDWPSIHEDKPIEDISRSENIMIGGDETVLLAEDEAGVRAITREMLHSLGYNVIEASNGQEAIEIIRRNIGRINLVISDVVMPEMGGFELAEQLKKISPCLQILLATGYTDHRIVEKSNIELVLKPFHMQKLAQKVRQVLDRKQSAHVFN